jgi:hypothetical protein
VATALTRLGLRRSRSGCGDGAGLIDWSLDFSGPLVTTRSKKRFVLIGIEHFSKWCEVWALPNKLSTKVAEVFLGVMTRYGACAELLTDNGQEFAGELDVLCRQLLITHRTTSRYHPQSNGLTERLVKTIKGGITRFGTENDRRTWDEWLPYLVMGYCMSNQTALGGYSPYFLMHGRQPMLTGQAARQLPGDPIDFDSPEQWVKACEQRAEVLNRDALRTGEPAGGAATGPAAVGARAEDGLPAAGAEISGGRPGVPTTTARQQHRRFGVEGGLQSTPGRGQRADGLPGRGRDAV